MSAAGGRGDSEHFLEPISEEARQRRRSTHALLEGKLPDYVLSIAQSEVMLTIEPRFVPLAQVDFPTLERILGHAYNLHFDRPDLAPLLEEISREELATLSSQDLISRLLRLPDATLSFGNGKFPVSRSDFVPIRKVLIDRESIFVSVEGISTVADLIAKEVAEALWTSAGASKRWEDIEPSVQLIAYASGTKVNLGFPFEQLLDPRFRSFIEGSILSDAGGLGSAMGPQYGPAYRIGVEPGLRHWMTVSLDELHLLFSRFDRITGQKVESVLRFSVRARGERSRGIVQVSSQLPIDKHLQLLEELKTAMREGAALDTRRGGG